MSKTFAEVWNEIKEGVKTTPNGKKKKTFSRSDFDDMLKALLNETEYEMTTASIKNGVMVEKTIKPVELYRESLKKLAIAVGMDAQDAEKFMTVSIKDVSGMYEIASEIIYKYIEADKKFDFVPRPDFVGSLTLADIGPSEKVYKSIRKPGDTTPQTESTVKTKKHKKLECKGKAPKWCKEKVKNK